MNDIKTLLQEADAVLIGAGAGLSTSAGFTYSGERFKKYFADFEKKYKNCLETASQNQLESIAFCCISTGVFRFPQDLAAQIAAETVEKWLSENPETSVKKVVFNVFGNKDLEIYKKVFAKQSNGGLIPT